MKVLKNILLKNATIISLKNNAIANKKDILIQKSKIKSIGTIQNNEIDQNIPIIESNNLHVCLGFTDLHVRSCDPGLEQKENFDSLVNAAITGGFTSIAISPKTNPVSDNKSAIQYVVSQSKKYPINIFPIAPISKGLKGKQITELFDLYQNGAKAFSDEKNSIQNANLLKTAMLYTKNFNGLIMNFPNEKSLSQGGVMNEGNYHVTLGMIGMSAVAEETMISRDLALAKYYDVAIHFSTISTKNSVNLIKMAKNDGLKISCDVAYYNLIYSDEMLKNFDSNFKTNPPLRSQSDIDSLIQGINDGTIDAITSDHCPVNIENKKCEFENAEFGMSSIEIMFPLLLTHLQDKISFSKLISCLTKNPNNILKLKQSKIEIDEFADLTIFDPTILWNIDKKNWKSKSQNHPIFKLNTQLKGKVLGIVTSKN